MFYSSHVSFKWKEACSNPTCSILSLRLRNSSSGSRRNSKNNNNDTSIKDSHSDFLRKKDNAARLVRLLKTIEAAGKDGISTRELCKQAFKTRNYGMRVINGAYDEGYIKRFGKSKHSPKKINYLSDKGIEMLSQLQQHEEEE
jgi:hypothetical protein